MANPTPEGSGSVRRRPESIWAAYAAGWQIIAYSPAARGALMRLQANEYAAVQGTPSTRIARIGRRDRHPADRVRGKRAAAQEGGGR
jgi:hypothetical protein